MTTTTLHTAPGGRHRAVARVVLNPAGARSIGRTVTRAALLLAALAGPTAAITAASASAAQYTVDACQHPNGAAAPADGWVGSARGAFVYYGNYCERNGSLHTRWSGAVEHSYQDGSSWAFTAPSGTSLAHITARREAEPGLDRPYGSPVTYVTTDQGPIEQCTRYSGCQGLLGDISYALNNATVVAAGIVCGGGPGGSCPVGETSNSIKRIAVTLNDDQAPALNGPPSGSLLSDRTTTRQRTLNYSATDQGGGVYRHRLLVDGTEVASGVVDDNEGKCARYPGGGFSYRVPCRTAVSGSIALDTSALKDGAHELTLEIRDATDANKVAYGPWPITVDNRPPSIGPTPVGTTTIIANGGKDTRQPHPGDVLAIVPPRYAGSATIAFQWFRCDSSGQSCAAIPGAVDANYTVADADRDRRLVGQVAATDASGTSTSRSEPTGVVTSGGSGTAGPVKDAGPGAAGGPGALALEPGAPNGSNACRDAKITARFVSGSTTTVRYGRPATLRGKLICGPTGRAIGGARIALTARTLGRTAFTPAAVITTAPDGTFTQLLAKGPGRQLSLSYTAVGGDATAAATSSAMMLVRGRVTLKRVRPLVKRRGGRIVFRGRIHGGQIPSGFQLMLQAQDGRRWRLADPIKVKANGTFQHIYRCKCQQPGARYRFRVTIPSGTRLAYTVAHSRSYSVRVR